MRMKKIKLIMGACFLSVATAVAGMVWGSLPAKSDNLLNARALEAFTSETVADFYEYGEEFTVPTATISYNGKDVPSTKSVIVYPSGAIYTSATHTLQEQGIYKIIYYADVSGNTISAEISFFVGMLKNGNEVLDKTAPTLTLHEGFSENIEHKIAIGESVVIPKATAIDENLLGGVSVNVYYNYDSATQSIVNTAQGILTPTKTGRYTLLYSAIDAFGNKTEKLVHVSCGVAEKNVAAILSVKDFTADAGANVIVPKCELKGLYKDSSLVNVYAQFENDELEKIEDYVYFPKNIGDYKIIYQLETPFATYKSVATLTTKNAGNTEIGEAFIPKYFIKGYKYSLDDVMAYSFTEKYPLETLATAFISEDGGEYKEIDAKDFSVNATEFVKFKFVCGTSVVETATAKVVNVFDNGLIKAERYFYTESDEIVPSAESNGIRYSVVNGNGDYVLDFVNVLSLSSLNFEFTIPVQDATTGAKFNEMEGVEITISDYYDSNNKMFVLYENIGGTLTLSANGGKKTTLNKNFEGVKNIFCYTSTFIDSTSSTEFPWKGSFSSDKVFLSVKLLNVNGGAGISISRIGRQSVNAKTTTDSIAATVYVKELQSGIRSLNSIATLYPAQITDVLTPYYEKNLTFTVTDPNGEYAKSVDGVTLDENCDASRVYELELTSYGVYMVLYSYRDQSGNLTPIAYAINVPERVAPKIALKGVQDGDIVKGTVNTKIYIADYEIFDETTVEENLRMYVYVFSPDLTTVELKVGQKLFKEQKYFNATEKGDYTVMYCCLDEEGNYCLISYTVRVS